MWICIENKHCCPNLLIADLPRKHCYLPHSPHCKICLEITVASPPCLFSIQIYNYDGGAAVFYRHTYNEEGGEAQCFLSKFYNE
jgi:hypothetical protein